ncbi:MAG: ATP-binding protein [Desulfotomaculum sp.]|nr:ATP-binding protein [Desulfotomaculum sp.]
MSAVKYAKRLTVYRQILEDKVVKAAMAFLQQEREDEKIDSYGELFYRLAEANEKNVQFTSNGWQNHLLNLLLYDDNPFSRQAAVWGPNINFSLRSAAEHDLMCLQKLFTADISMQPVNVDEMTSWGQKPVKNKQAVSLVENLTAAARWQGCIDLLIDYYHTAGVGIYGRYHILRWDGEKRRIVGVDKADPVKLTDLIGYHSERQKIIDNTEAFLNGKPANNVLLYGDRGTGKSSTVKALANTYGLKGLRLVEIPKQYLGHFSIIVNQLADYPQHFILFIDDLSFEDYEIEYKALKAVLEGGVEIKPQNVLIYATSNRRHLIRESFSERQQDEVHAADSIQEKLSLSDRFGLTVTFTAPDQKQYLEIVEGLASQYGLNVRKEELHHKALQWVLNHSGRSGRAARQFIEYMVSKIK